MRRANPSNPDVSPPLDIDHAIGEYRYPASKRKNIPPAGLSAQGKVKETPRHKFAYNPHLPPVLRSDPSGQSDKLPELLQAAQSRPLTPDETKLLADALRNREPWLEWAGKREAQACEVDPVALHIHERVSAQAILRVAAREDTPRNLFADPEQDYREAVQFYEHDVAWSNRLILGDSLQVMASLSRREDLAGKVQMIYMDPPYGIKFGSNFQSQVGKRDVKDGRDEDLTREPETVKAYRDTWQLGVHSYLGYLRDRLYLVKSLLTDSGSVFLQISDENLHRVRLLMDEVFGPENHIAIINCTKTSGQTSKFLSITTDYILWYAKNSEQLKYHRIFDVKALGSEASGMYQFVSLADGISRRLTGDEIKDPSLLPKEAIVFRLGDITSQRQGRASGPGSAMHFPVEVNGNNYYPPSNRGWSTTADGMKRLASADRLSGQGERLAYVRCLDDFVAVEYGNNWTDTAGATDRVYVVQTNTKIIERCMLMTTDPGDLVLDPTCGSGTTAYVAEQWGRRWITIDSSRVALAIARQRLLTARHDYFTLKQPDKGVSGGFVYKTVPHITLKSIAQNQALDPIFARWEPILAQRLAALNYTLTDTVTPDLRKTLRLKLAEKEKRDGKKAITDAARRRLVLPEQAWNAWEVPFDTDTDWPAPLQDALRAYRADWRAKMDEVNRTIAASAEQEELVDRPDVVRNVLRVSGPFTVEGVIPAEESLDLDDSPIAGEPDALDTFGANEPDAHTAHNTHDAQDAPANAEAYLDKMLRLLRMDGVRFRDNVEMRFTRLDPVAQGLIHAEGAWQAQDGEKQVGVVFGPQHGPVTSRMLETVIPAAARHAYDALIVAGFSFDAHADALLTEDGHPRLRLHKVHIRPDVNMEGLKDTPSSHLFTVSGLPRTELKTAPNGEWQIEMQGVDIYEPLSGTIRSASAREVAAWFVDSNYDGRTFCITQAFFPDPKAWEKLSKALTGVVDAERFAAFSGTLSLPFPAGDTGQVAVKVIDPRGNEVMRVHTIPGRTRYV